MAEEEPVVRMSRVDDTYVVRLIRGDDGREKRLVFDTPEDAVIYVQLVDQSSFDFEGDDRES
jgi:hypothetical protein